MDARITGNDISVGSVSTTSKSANVDRDFSFRTRAVALGDIDGAGDADLVMATEGQGIFLYPNDGGHFGAPITIESAVLNTTSLALGDIDGDGDLDLLAGNRGQPNRIYLNTAAAFGASVSFGLAIRTTAVALANLDNDSMLELVVGTDGDGILRYDFAGGVFGSA